MSQCQDLGENDAPNVDELGDEGHWTLLARQHWSKSVEPRKIRQEVIKKDIWERLQSENFEIRSLVVLENLQLLEKSVWTAQNIRTFH